ncbi:MAG: SpoIIE family protein phosphatase, partial [Planctomycetota bacterium]|nr:SpoIIE family protein phosphatase [Planctomycetota bacterium]
MTPAADQDRRVGGLPLRTKFTLTMSLSLALVMVVAGYLLMQSVSRIAARALENRVLEAVELTTRELQSTNFEQVGEKATGFRGSPILRYDAIYGLDRGEMLPAWYYEYRDENLSDEQKLRRRFLVPKDPGELGKGVAGLIAGITLVVIIVGAFVALLVSNHVVQPLNSIVNDIRQIARGNLHHRSRVKGGGEVALLARTVNRMAEELEEAQENEIELSAREREMEVANEVREALHVEAVPACAGYELGGTHVGAPQPGGDFHDFIALGDGRVGVLVCGVSGQGVPGALVGATARAYLRGELSRNADSAEALRLVNGFLASDVRRGMFVTAMYALIDPGKHEVEVACAGHKVPLLHLIAAKRSVRLVQPEGI